MTNRCGKAAIFIDGANLQATCKSLGFVVDFKRLLSEFGGDGILRASYYFVVADGLAISPAKPLLDWLVYNGYTVVAKSAKQFADAAGRINFRSDMDVELTVHAMTLARYVDRIILFSGDGAFQALVKALQRRGVRVTVVSSIVTHPPMIASDLRRQADVFLDLNEMRGQIAAR